MPCWELESMNSEEQRQSKAMLECGSEMTASVVEACASSASNDCSCSRHSSVQACDACDEVEVEGEAGEHVIGHTREP